MDYVALVHNRLLHPWSLLSLVHIKVRDAIQKIKNVIYGNNQQIEEISIRLHRILYTYRVHYVSLKLKLMQSIFLKNCQGFQLCQEFLLEKLWHYIFSKTCQIPPIHQFYIVWSSESSHDVSCNICLYCRMYLVKRPENLKVASVEVS